MPGVVGSTSAPTPAYSAGSCSADITTDNMLEGVQKHLDALGYDAGNTNGESSLMTSIAMSQFQAENGLEVTGEVSPQLLGVLSADSRSLARNPPNPPAHADSCPTGACGLIFSKRPTFTSMNNSAHRVVHRDAV